MSVRKVIHLKIATVTLTFPSKTIIILFRNMHELKVWDNSPKTA